MRAYGRFMKNIAALALLFALLSLLLPFCSFQAAGQDMTLSGLDVLKAGGSAAYTYIQQGSVPDDHIMKAPFSWGDVKEGLHYADDAGASDLLIAGGVAAGLPILFCLLAMCMLFLAEGSKTMVVPTFLTLLTVLELAVALLGFPALHPYLLTGVYLFAVLHVVALVFILFGWLTGGYREPDRKERDRSRRNDSGDDGRSGRRKHRHKRGKRKKSGRKRSKKDSNDKKNKEKKDQSKDEKKKEAQPKAAAAVGNVCDGTGIYQGFQWNLRNETSSRVTIGTTPEAMRGIETGGLKAAGHIADHNCQISYHPEDGSYTIDSHAAERIVLRQNGKALHQLNNGDSVRVLGQVKMEVGSSHSMWLK